MCVFFYQAAAVATSKNRNEGNNSAHTKMNIYWIFFSVAFALVVFALIATLCNHIDDNRHVKMKNIMRPLPTWPVMYDGCSWISDFISLTIL